MDDIIGESQCLVGCRREVDLVARHAEVSVLLVGETGVGKELFARRLHEHSGRRGPMVSVNIGALASPLLESELFGHVRGAFTGAVTTQAGYFEIAAGGTLFLDEIGELPTALQAKLLRIIEERLLHRVGDPRAVDIDVRIVSATCVDLQARVDEGTFRRDLYYRLAGLEVAIPPLRHRPGDVRLLAMAFLRHMTVGARPPVTGFDDAALDRLESAAWPGNVRQLENVVRMALYRAAASGATSIHREHLDVRLLGETPTPTSSLSEELDQAERQIAAKALFRSRGNRSEAARLLGWSPNTLRARMRRWGLDPTG